VFNIAQREYQLIELLATKTDFSNVDLNGFALVSGDLFMQGHHTKYIFQDQFPGQLAVIKLNEVGLLAKYVGEEPVQLNGVDMLPGLIYPLATGSSVKGKRFHPVYQSEVLNRFLDDDQPERITFEAREVSYTFSNGKTGLHEFSLAEYSGRLIGIMGPSGSGKSTLLEVLNGNLKPSQGRILVNGVDLHIHRNQLEGAIGYVPQDDLLIEDLTVFQNLYYAAKLCFGKFSDAQLEQLVNKTLSDLGLAETANLKVGNAMNKTISGGERKRLNIGLELLRAPQILFVDEPTSGLSSRDSLNIMDLLKDLTLEGKLVFVVIHQPSSDIFKMFDKMLIMDTGGFPIYYGVPEESINYFKSLIHQVRKDQPHCHECGNINPEQIFDVVEAKTVNEFGKYTAFRKVSPAQWYASFREHVKVYALQPTEQKISQTFQKASRLKQLVVFATRDFLSKANNRQYLAINLLQAPLLGFLLAYFNRFHIQNELEDQVYTFGGNDNIPTFIFIAIIVCLFFGLTVSAEEIFHDRKILKRESFLHLSRGSYLLSKLLILFGLSAIQSGTFLLVSSYLLNIEALGFQYWLVLFSASCFANLLGLNISSAFNSAVTIYILIPILLIPQLVLGGIVIKFDKINPDIRNQTDVPLVCELMASRWAYEALMVGQFKDNPYQKPLFEIERMKHLAEYKRIFYIPTLKAKADFCRFNMASPIQKDKDQIEKNFTVLRNELAKEMKAVPTIAFSDYGKLNKGQFNDQVAENLERYLDKLFLHYVDMNNKGHELENNYVLAKTANASGSKDYLTLSERFRNLAVDKMVKNTEEQTKIIEYKGQLIQKASPIFKLPDDRSNPLDFRTHFFSAVKPFLGKNWDTVYFNVFVLWLMSGFLYVALYHNWLKKLLQWQRS
jgi:ABC-type multidrug transport system ATPase subunit